MAELRPFEMSDAPSRGTERGISNGLVPASHATVRVRRSGLGAARLQTVS